MSGRVEVTATYSRWVLHLELVSLHITQLGKPQSVHHRSTTLFSLKSEILFFDIELFTFLSIVANY